MKQIDSPVRKIRSADSGIESATLRRCRLCGLPMAVTERLKAHRRCVTEQRRRWIRQRQAKAARAAWRGRKL